MKNRLPHIVPLSEQVKVLFQAQLATVKNGDYVFPSLTRPGKHAGLSTLNIFFDRMGFADRLTPHGLRAVASTKLNGTRRFAGDVIELQLAKLIGVQQTRRLYTGALGPLFSEGAAPAKLLVARELVKRLLTEELGNRSALTSQSNKPFVDTQQV